MLQIDLSYNYFTERSDLNAPRIEALLYLYIYVCCILKYIVSLLGGLLEDWKILLGLERAVL